jgi:hypothetical protein
VYERRSQVQPRPQPPVKTIPSSDSPVTTIPYPPKQPKS